MGDLFYQISLFLLSKLLSEGFPASLIWNPWVLMKVNFFTLGKRIITLNLLNNRGMKVLKQCYLCKDKEKSTNHIPSLKVNIVWHLILAIFYVQQVKSLSFLDALT